MKTRDGKQLALTWADLLRAPEDRYVLGSPARTGTSTGLPALSVPSQGAGPSVLADVGSIEVVRIPGSGSDFPDTTPVHLVYDAGVAGRRRRVKTTLASVVAEIGRQEETFLGLVYIGAGLR